MENTDYINLSINIEQGAISLTKNENDKSKAKFDISEDDAADNNVRVELSIAKVFHKVLTLIKDDNGLFQAEDFELLGEMLARILFGKSSNLYDVRNPVMKSIEEGVDSTNILGSKICRIFLEFDQNSGVAMLPWEYTLYRTRGTKKKTVYLSANAESRFHLMRRVDIKETPEPKTRRIFVIALTYVEGNKNVPKPFPEIGNRTRELPEVKTMFEELEKDHTDSFEVEYLESVSYDKIKESIETIYRKWEQQYNERPYYILHYLGHAYFKDQMGRLVVKSADYETGMEWKEDKKFASLFKAGNLKVPQPSVVCFQACDSAKIGSLNQELRGVAYEFTKLGIPAVVGMQNEINTTTSCAFFNKFYASVLQGKDVAEAVTVGRDYLGREYHIEDETYINNYFGSPVLFITTKEPIRLFMQAPSLQPQKNDNGEKQTSTSIVRPSEVVDDRRGRVGETQMAQTTGSIETTDTPRRPLQNQNLSEKGAFSSEAGTGTDRKTR